MTPAVDNPVESVEKSLSGQDIHSDDNASQVLGVFAKQPLPGQVKTRLCPPCSLEQAAALYQVCLVETMNRMGAAGRKLVLFYAGERDWFKQRFPGLELRPQGEGDLGRRMMGALQGLLAEGYDAAALIGSDSPDLPLSLVDEAFSVLRGCDAVAAPADDGGYVLIGCSKPCPQLFTGIAWSTGAVLCQTREAAKKSRLDFRQLSAWEDLDDAAALQRLLQRSPESQTERFIRQNLASLL